jgi:nucleoside-diphosphate kinase
MRLVHATKEQAAEHYAEHKERPFFGSLVEFLSSGPMVLLAYEGKGVVATSRMMIGATNPLASAPGTVRGDFGIEVDRYVTQMLTL